MYNLCIKVEPFLHSLVKRLRLEKSRYGLDYHKKMFKKFNSGIVMVLLNYLFQITSHTSSEFIIIFYKYVSESGQERFSSGDHLSQCRTPLH